MTREQSMTSKSSDVSSQGLPQGENVAAPTPQSGQPEHQTSRSRNQVFKSGPLFISSKGIGWTSWKKRWFVLTRTSLVFYRSDPSQSSQKGGEVNLTLGGIDLNNSASLEVKADKKLLTLFFPEGRDGRAFTLKAETMEDLQEWKTALENALAQAPNAPNSAGQNGVKNDQADDSNGDDDEKKDGPPAISGKSMVLGRPILLALEDIDGSPSFLEKALRFIEDHGVKVEGVLRQAADVDEVYRRVREYEQGKTEFSPDEDAHIIGDCIKYILRELPSSPVPASCCNALLQAFRTDRNNRVNAMRTAILDTFPEPNRRLLQRILQMMQIVASNKNVNRMSTSAVAACMSPLLLRPLLAGECDLGDTHMDVAGDGSFQLLQAAAAANHAQAIIITLLDEYDKIFGDGSGSDGGLFSDSDESGSGTEEASDDDMYEDDDDGDDDYLEDDDHDDDHDDHEETDDDDDYEHSVYSGSSDGHGESDSNDDKAKKNLSMESIDFQLDEEDEIERLEATKRELENRIEEEASGNSKMQASLERRKRALHERRLALEKDVTRLQEQLQRERDLRATLEAECGPEIAGMPEKVELHSIEIAEEKFSNLKQRLDDINDELHYQNDETLTLLEDINIEGTTSMYNDPRYDLQNKGMSKNEISQQPSKKNQSQPSDVQRGSSLKFGWLSGYSSSIEPSILKPSHSTSRKSNAKGEGSSNTNSALSKLTNRLNFLKERRNQIANELQSIDKGRVSSTQPVISPDKGNRPEPAQNTDKSPSSGGSFSEKVEDRAHQASHSSGKGSINEVDKNKDNGKKSEASSSHHDHDLDQLKSEGGESSSKNSYEGQQQDAKPSTTLSR